MDSLQLLSGKIIGENGHHFAISYFEDIPFTVFENLLSCLSPETLNRLCPLIRKRGINIDDLWAKHYEDRWHTVCLEGWSNVKISAFGEERTVTCCSLYQQRHFKEIISWIFEKSQDYENDPSIVYRCPTHILQSSRHKKSKFMLSLTGKRTAEKDIERIVEYTEKLTLRGGWCERLLTEEKFISLILPVIQTLEIIAISAQSIKMVLKLLTLFVSSGHVKHISLCLISVTKSELIDELLMIFAGKLHIDNLSNSRQEIQTLTHKHEFTESVDLLDEALIADSQYLETGQHLQIDSTENDGLYSIPYECESVSAKSIKPGCAIESFTLRDVHCPTLIQSIAKVMPYWNCLKRIEITSIEDIQMEKQLLEMFLQMIKFGHMTDVKFEIRLIDPLNLVKFFVSVMTIYQNGKNTVKPLNSLFVSSLDVHPFPETRNEFIRKCQNFYIPDDSNFCKRLALHTCLFEFWGFEQLSKLLCANKLMENLNLKVLNGFDTNDMINSRSLISTIASLSCPLHTLILDLNCLEHISSDLWIELLKQKPLLQHLSLSGCRLDKNIFKDDHFIFELSGHSNLRYLDLSYNGLGVDVLRLLEQIIQRKGSFQTLVLHGNGLSLDSILHITKSLSEGPIKQRLINLLFFDSIMDGHIAIVNKILGYCKYFVKNVHGFRNIISELPDIRLEFVAMM